MVKAGKRIGILLIGALLLFLFTVPSIYLSRVSDELILQAEAAGLAVAQGADPAPHIQQMERLIDESAPLLRLFLDHALVDATRMAIHALDPQLEGAHLSSELAALTVSIEHLRSAELFSFAGIL